MKDALEVVALFLGFVGWILVYVSLEDNYWKESSQAESVIVTSTVYENLWRSCASDSTGVYDCRDFQTLLGLPGFCNTPAERLLRTGTCGQQTVVFSKAEILGWLELVAVEKSEQTGQKKQENMNAIVEGLACFLGFLSWLMVGLALRNRHWRDSTFDGNLIMSSSVYENLWISCATDSTGVHNCRDFPSMFELNGYIQASRALMIASIVFGSFGLVGALVGMQCSKIGGKNYVLKGRIAAIGGVFFILQGLCTMIAVSWYAANITQQFFDQLFAGTKYEIGQGLYIGWFSAVLALCGGACLLCACQFKSPDEKIQYAHQRTTRAHIRSITATSGTPSNYGRNAYV